MLDALPRIAPSARAGALTWLADVQVGGHVAQAAERPERKRRHELREDRAAARAVVAAATDALVAQLDDADPDVRSAAALALAFTVDAPAEAKAALGRRLARETVAGVQASLILACVRLGTGFRPPAPEPIIAGAIAIATAFDGPPDIAALTAATALPTEPHLAFARGELGRVAIGILRQQSPETQAEAAGTIAERALAEGDARLALLACEMAFGKASREAAPRLLEELTPDQRRVVRNLAELRAPLDWRGFGLPPTVAGRRRYLAVDPDGPCDRFVADGDREVPLWFALRRRAASEGVDAARAELKRIFERLAAGERLAIYLDRDAHGLDDVFEGWALADLLAGIAGDADGARAAVDALHAAPARSTRGLELLRAIAATRKDGEELAEALLAELDGHALSSDDECLRRFTPAAIARRLNAILEPLVAGAVGRDAWTLGLHHDLEVWSKVLRSAPSPSATRRMLLLGWASGQPASVRQAIGDAAKGHASLEAVLADYDRLPQFKSWPDARAAMSSYAQ